MNSVSAEAPHLKRVFTVVASKLFQTSLNATRVWEHAKIKDCALRATFKEATGLSLGRYIATARRQRSAPER